MKCVSFWLLSHVLHDPLVSPERQAASRGVEQRDHSVREIRLFNKANIATALANTSHLASPILRAPSTKGLVLHGPCAQNTVKQPPRWQAHHCLETSDVGSGQALPERLGHLTLQSRPFSSAGELNRRGLCL